MTRIKTKNHGLGTQLDPELRSVISENSKDFPNTINELNLTWEPCRIEFVDPKTKKLKCFGMLTRRRITDVQYTSLLFDAKNGTGVYVTPKKGMTGLLMEVGHTAYFTLYTGSMDRTGETGFSNSREEAPPGSFIFKTSRETKGVASPNLLHFQASNFCRLLMKRVSKAVHWLFYSWTMRSLGASFSWVTDIRRRTTRIFLKLRDRLPDKKDQDGNTKDETEKYELSVDLGLIDDETRARFNLSKAEGPFDQLTTETPAVRTFRALLKDLFTERKVTSRDDLFLEKNKDLLATFVDPLPDFTVTHDKTLDLLIESIIDGATFTSKAQAEGPAANPPLTQANTDIASLKPKVIIGKGIKELLPEFDSKQFITDELGKDGEVVRLTDEDYIIEPTGNRVVELDDNFEFFLPANPLENKDTEREPYEQPNVARPLIKKAREAKTEKDRRKFLNRFDATLSRSGDLDIDQLGGITYDLISRLFLRTQEGPFDFDAGDGIRILARKGMLYLGTKEAGITFTPDGEIVFTSRKETHRVWKDFPPAMDRSELEAYAQENGPATNAEGNPTTLEEKIAATEGAYEAQQNRRAPKDSTPDQISDEGTLLEITPDGFRLETRHDISLKAGGDATLESRSQLTREITKTETLRDDLKTLSGIPRLDDIPELESEEDAALTGQEDDSA